MQERGVSAQNRSHLQVPSLVSRRKTRFAFTLPERRRPQDPTRAPGRVAQRPTTCSGTSGFLSPPSPAQGYPVPAIATGSPSAVGKATPAQEVVAAADGGGERPRGEGRVLDALTQHPSELWLVPATQQLRARPPHPSSFPVGCLGGEAERHTMALDFSADGLQLRQHPFSTERCPVPPAPPALVPSRSAPTEQYVPAPAVTPKLNSSLRNEDTAPWPCLGSAVPGHTPPSSAGVRSCQTGIPTQTRSSLLGQDLCNIKRVPHCSECPADISWDATSSLWARRPRFSLLL